MPIVGLDIGGANIKAADETGIAISRPFPIWQRPQQLSEELAAILHHFPDAQRVVLTMTAELADCFTTKSEGVHFILDAVETSWRQHLERLHPRKGEAPAEPQHQETHQLRGSAGASRLQRTETTDVVVWSTEGQFAAASKAREIPLKIAASNWHALSTWCGQFAPSGCALVVDIGTTTTDIIPLSNGTPDSLGLTDVGRLQNGELCYSGVRRTPLCAIAHSVPFQKGYCSLAAELFATTLDVYLLLDLIPEDPSDLETANGKPATKQAAHDRIARMLCCDRDEISFGEAVEIARFLADVQRQRLAGALEKVISRQTGSCHTVIVSGSGSFLARQLVAQNRRTADCKIILLDDVLSPGVSEAACAFAVAQLAAQMKKPG